MSDKLGSESRYWLIDNDRDSLRAEYTEKLRLLDALPKTDWHAGFGAGTEIMTCNMDNVDITPEYELGTAPPRMDFLFVSRGDAPLKGDVFKYFKKFNVLEYKRPDDDINMRVIHKVLGYANFLIGVAKREGEVPENEVTIAVFRAKKNKKLFRELESIGGIVQGDAPGVYYLTKEVSNLPFQIVITSELEGAENCYWRALTDETTISDFKQIVDQVSEFKDDSLEECGRFYLELIIRKNPGLVKTIGKDPKMHSVLLDIVKDDVDAMIAETTRKVMLESRAQSVKNASTALGYTFDQAMDMLKIPEDQRQECAALAAAM